MTSDVVGRRVVSDIREANGPACLLSAYRAVRRRTEAICAPLAVEDYIIQGMTDVSPPKWHLAHTAWFFETFLLIPYLEGYRSHHPRYHYLFNSYYETVGPFFPRQRRGLLSRPTVDEVYRYRAHVDQGIEELLGRIDERHPAPQREECLRRLLLGIHHEQQHQELLFTDIKYNFAINPLRPAYREAGWQDAAGPPAPGPGAGRPAAWIEYPGGVKWIGHQGEGFAYDNEGPRHRVYVNDFAIAPRLVTNGEYLEFMEAGGYTRPEYWLSEGWKTVKEQGWEAPLYWERIDGRWWLMTLSGPRPVHEAEPVCHVSYYEADAYARWRGRRLPEESEWETAAAGREIAGNLLESDRLHPAPAAEIGTDVPQQFYGDVWEWTRSAYAPYPGYRAASGAIGEYNGKFMSNQMVLRGGSCVSSRTHIRASYRNFFYPADRWQFSGIRLADDR